MNETTLFCKGCLGVFLAKFGVGFVNLTWLFINSTIVLNIVEIQRMLKEKLQWMRVIF